MFSTRSETMQSNTNRSGLTMPGFGPCTDLSCDGTFVRLFDCAHHCTKMVCLRHLIEHDRRFEREKKELDGMQTELQRVWSIYASLVDETKIQQEFEQKLNEHTQLTHRTNTLLGSSSTDIERFRIVVDQLKKAICEKERQPTRSSAIVKVEPRDETLARDIEEKHQINSLGEQSFGIASKTTHRPQNVSSVNKSNHTRTHIDNCISNNNNVFQSNNDMIIANDDGHYTIDTLFPIWKISGECPLWINGAFGLSKEHHDLRLCKPTHLHLLNKHMRNFHGLLAPTANLLTRAVYSKVPVTKRLVANDTKVSDSRRSFLCPFGVGPSSRCSNQCRLPALALKSHLINVHQISRLKAKNLVEKLRAQRSDTVTKNIKKRSITYDDRCQITEQKASVKEEDMPIVGTCTEVTCDNGTKELYECHCCTRFICLLHLIQHDEKSTQNKLGSPTCIDQLTAVCCTLKMIIDEKMCDIEREKTLLKEAKTVLEICASSDEMQRVLDRVNEVIAANQKKETVVKVEPSLAESCSVIAKNGPCQYSFYDEPTSAYGETLLDNTWQESLSVDNIQSTCDDYHTSALEEITTNARRTFTATSTINHDSMDMNESYFRIFLHDDTIDSNKDNSDDKAKQAKLVTVTKFRRKCPLTFYGAFGLTKTKNSFCLCNRKTARPPLLYYHFQHVHCIKADCARRLVQAIARGENANTTKVFSDEEDILNPHRFVVCPFNGCTSNPFGCHPEQIPNIPCSVQSILPTRFVFHLISVHCITVWAARAIVDNYETNSTKILFSENDDIVRKEC